VSFWVELELAEMAGDKAESGGWIDWHSNRGDFSYSVSAGGISAAPMRSFNVSLSFEIVFSMVVLRFAQGNFWQKKRAVHHNRGCIINLSLQER
jgi:hypothetical protein